MAYHVLKFKIQKLGFCCPFAYFTAVANTPTGEVAVELGVHKRTARKWRAAFRAGDISCRSATHCYRSEPVASAPYPAPDTASRQSILFPPLPEL